MTSHVAVPGNKCDELGGLLMIDTILSDLHTFHLKLELGDHTTAPTCSLQLVEVLQPCVLSYIFQMLSSNRYSYTFNFPILKHMYLVPLYFGEICIYISIDSCVRRQLFEIQEVVLFHFLHYLIWPSIG